MSRDMTKAEFEKKLAKHGFRRAYLGYVTVYDHPDGGCTRVYPGNAGPRRRDQLRYLLHQRERVMADYAVDAIVSSLAHQLRSGVAS